MDYSINTCYNLIMNLNLFRFFKKQKLAAFTLHDIVLIVTLIFILLTFAAVVKGVYMRLNYSLYKGDRFSFQYPNDWTLRESKGSHEKYFQVHIFGKIDKALGFGPSVALTVYPKKPYGGKFSTLQEMVDQHLSNAKKLSGYHLESQRVASLPAHALAHDVEMSFALRLPLYKTTAKDVPVKQRMLFFEMGSEFFVLNYQNLSQDYPTSKGVFQRVIRTLRFKS